MKSINSKDPADTIKLGRRLGSALKGGEIIRLIGDVGTGKTTFVRGLVAGIDSSDHVSSPTFTAHKLYKGKVTLYHYDFYRVRNDKMIMHELSEIMREAKTAVVLEWPEYTEAAMPVQPIDVKFEVTLEAERKLSVLIPSNFKYISLA